MRVSVAWVNERPGSWPQKSPLSNIQYCLESVTCHLLLRLINDLGSKFRFARSSHNAVLPPPLSLKLSNFHSWLIKAWAHINLHSHLCQSFTTEMLKYMSTAIHFYFDKLSCWLFLYDFVFSSSAMLIFSHSCLFGSLHFAAKGYYYRLVQCPFKNMLFKGGWQVGLWFCCLLLLRKAQSNKITPHTVLPWALSHTPVMT